MRSCGSSCYSKGWVCCLTSNIGNSLICLRKTVGSRHVTAAPGVSLLLTDQEAISAQYLCTA